MKPKPKPTAPPLARFYTRNGKAGVTELVDRKYNKVLSQWSSATEAFEQRNRLEGADAEKAPRHD